MTPASLLIPVWIMAVSGNYAVTRQQVVHNIVPAVNAIIAPLQVRVRKYRRIRKPQPFQMGDPALGFPQDSNWGMYTTYADGLNWLKRGHIVHTIIPPYRWQNALWVGGMSGGLCYRRTWEAAMSNALATRSNGADGLSFSAWAMAHEIMHSLAVPHDDTPNQLMHPNMLSFVDRARPMPLQSSIDKALRCQLLRESGPKKP